MRRHLKGSATRWPRVATTLWALSCWAAVPTAGAQPTAAWLTGWHAVGERSWQPGLGEGALAPEMMTADLREAAPAELPGASGAGTAAGLVATAERFVGTRYRWGGQSTATGFDCSGFVGRVFAAHGIDLPRTARAMASAGTALPASWELLRPGDIVLFAGRGSRISHVALYVGSRRIVHATSSGGRVRYDDLDTPRGNWYRRRMVAARRLIGDGATSAGELDLLDLRAPSAVTVEGTAEALPIPSTAFPRGSAPRAPTGAARNRRGG